MAAEKRKLPELEEHGPSPKKRVMGPSLPPDSNQSEDESDEESDDDFGPSLPPPQGASPAPVKQSTPPPDQPKAAPEKSQGRDQWMVEPPAHGDWASKVDPTQLRNRKFQGKSSGSGSSKQLDASWVENPEERLRRLGDQVMGVATSQQPQATSTSDAKKAASMEEKIKKFNDQTRKTPRLEASQTRKEEDDDPSIRAFDREKDMAISSRISSAQRREMVNKAGDYGSRFTKGNFL
ncbi:hypothetical protein N7492_007860 [Penicillium capsulatum]|uniref:DUF3752 domain-containing protein n=1 Tax=Penicillium capsulatum TaxID=69766 RepID=A0A9W9LM82_9EURO|nr:hypothetical protein N7492_007860 [Penicillium capsulatum]